LFYIARRVKKKRLGDTWRFQQEKASLPFFLDREDQNFCRLVSSYNLLQQQQPLHYSLLKRIVLFLSSSSSSSSSSHLLLLPLKSTKETKPDKTQKKQNKKREKKKTKTHIDTQKLTTKGKLKRRFVEEEGL
jgi:hypothetical protein